MANPPTKDKLESNHFLSTSAAVQLRLTACLRSDPSHIRPFSQPSEAIEAIKQGLNRVQPGVPGMKKITDPANTFGETMVEAVRAYKSFNGIIRTGQPLDNIVGRGTLARLDTELKNLGAGPNPNPNPTPLEFGSNQWRFSFFGNKGFFGKGIYTLFIASAQGGDSKEFGIDEVFASGNLLSGFKGETRGSFSTTKKKLAKDFDGCIADIVVSRTSRTLRGNLRLQKIVPDGVFEASFQLPSFRDETISFDDGTANIRGQVRSRR
jgi:hypothetical protein